MGATTYNPAFNEIKLAGSEPFGVYVKVFLKWLLRGLVLVGKFIFRYTLLLASKALIEVVNFFVPFFGLCGKELLQIFLYLVGVAAFSSLTIAFIALVFF